MLALNKTDYQSRIVEPRFYFLDAEDDIDTEHPRNVLKGLMRSRPKPDTKEFIDKHEPPFEHADLVKVVMCGLNELQSHLVSHHLCCHTHDWARPDDYSRACCLRLSALADVQQDPTMERLIELVKGRDYRVYLEPPDVHLRDRHLDANGLAKQISTEEPVIPREELVKAIVMLHQECWYMSEEWRRLYQEAETMGPVIRLGKAKHHRYIPKAGI